jgi:hypothetical protein
MEKKFVKQTGLYFKEDIRDYRVGASPLVPVILNEISDWTKWKPTDERQNKEFVFDTLSCATFSGLNDLETVIHFFIDLKKISDEQLKWLNDNGYIVDGKINCSDRFSAIVDGTTNKGNYMQAVWDSFRNIGCIPEKDLLFGGNNQAEYLDKTLITQAMLDKANKFREIFSFAYEWTSNIQADLLASLKECPIHIAINSGTHAVELISIDYRFDSYPPYLIKQSISGISYALKGIVSVKPYVAPIVTTQTLKLGSKGTAVKNLQTDLKALGYFKGIVDGDFGKITLASVKAFQKANSLVSDGIAGKITLAKIAELKKKLN